MTKALCTLVYTNKQIRELEKLSYNELSIPPSELMERAGKAAYSHMMKAWPNIKAITVVCGGGNNGGDGYVLAKYAANSGIKVSVLQVGKEGSSAETQAAIQECSKLKMRVSSSTDSLDFDHCDIIVDAILGVGLEGEKLKSDVQKIIEIINNANKLVLAIDCPSGINTDTGNALGVAVRADMTVTFIGLKQGLLTAEARDYCGELLCDNLDLPESVFDKINAQCSIYNMDVIKSLLPSRKKTSHKNNNGHVLIVGGNYGFAGAVKMAAEGALRAGAGLVSVATRKEHIGGIIAGRPEIMAHGIEKADDLRVLLERSNIVVLGPGLGQDKWAQELFKSVITANKVMLIDADGLNLLAQSKVSKQDNWILTPHQGEAARLLSSEISEIQSDRFEAIEKIQKQYGGNVVLKGAGSLILGESGKISICKYGNPGMGSGGMGDVLSGIIAAFVAQGLKPEEATILGVNVHSYAADLAARVGERGMIASDVIKFIRKVVN